MIRCCPDIEKEMKGNEDNVMTYSAEGWKAMSCK